MCGNRTSIIAIIGGEQKNQAVKKDGVCITLCSAMGTGGGIYTYGCNKRIALRRNS